MRFLFAAVGAVVVVGKNILGISVVHYIAHIHAYFKYTDPIDDT